jgi:hypothetical protein
VSAAAGTRRSRSRQHEAAAAKPHQRSPGTHHLLGWAPRTLRRARAPRPPGSSFDSAAETPVLGEEAVCEQSRAVASANALHMRVRGCRKPRLLPRNSTAASARGQKRTQTHVGGGCWSGHRPHQQLGGALQPLQAACAPPNASTDVMVLPRVSVRSTLRVWSAAVGWRGSAHTAQSWNRACKPF